MDSEACASGRDCRTTRPVTFSTSNIEMGARNSSPPRTSVRCTKKLADPSGEITISPSVDPLT